MPSLTITSNRSNHPDLPPHLGGHENETHADAGAIQYMIDNFGMKSMIDLGCGPAGHTKVAREMGIDVLAIDGDAFVPKVSEPVIIHDFSKEIFIPEKEFDVCWSCEVLEHIWPIYAPNYMECFKKSKWAVFTMAEEGQGGHHHVAEMRPERWIDVFSFYGFEVDIDHTNGIREASTMTARYLRQQGIVFRNSRYLELQRKYD